MGEMFDESRSIFIHGLEGTSQGAKATLLRGLFPRMLIPDFRGDLSERMAALYPILGNYENWTLIGSSFGGLMAALFTCQRPDQVRKLVMMAPALMLTEFSASPFQPVEIPTVVYHGSRDEVVPLAPTRQLAGQVFRNLTYHVVDDDHGLYQTAREIDWKELLK